jgi:hypothetical protein
MTKTKNGNGFSIECVSITTTAGFYPEFLVSVCVEDFEETNLVYDCTLYYSSLDNEVVDVSDVSLNGVEQDVWPEGLEEFLRSEQAERKLRDTSDWFLETADLTDAGLK